MHDPSQPSLSRRDTTTGKRSAPAPSAADSATKRLARCLAMAILTLATMTASAEPPQDIHFAHPNWSPRGDLIAMDCGPGGELDLCLYAVASQHVCRLTATAEQQEAVPVFSRDGKRISFSRERDDVWYLSILDLASGEIVELVRLTIPYASSSSWFPDGERLAFDMLNEAGDHDIYSVRLDGSDLQLLVGGPGSQRFATFSPDGTKLAYTHIADNAGDIMVAKRDGSEARALISHPADEGVPIWSPDGRRLTFYSKRTGNLEVFITDLEGNERQLTDNAAFDVFATFAPDGQTLVFESTRDRDPASFDRGADLFRLDLASREVVRLTKPADFPAAAARAPFERSCVNDAEAVVTPPLPRPAPGARR